MEGMATVPRSELGTIWGYRVLYAVIGIVLTLTGAAAGSLYARFTPPVYEASQTVLLRFYKDPVLGFETSSEQLTFYRHLVLGSLHSRVRSEAQGIDVDTGTGPPRYTVHVRHAQPGEARRLAQDIAAASVDYIRQWHQRDIQRYVRMVEDGEGHVDLTTYRLSTMLVVSESSAQVSAVSSSHAVTIGLIAGLGVSVLAAWAIDTYRTERRDHAVHSDTDL